jgi:hypothetical protein
MKLLSTRYSNLLSGHLVAQIRNPDMAVLTPLFRQRAIGDDNASGFVWWHGRSADEIVVRWPETSMSADELQRRLQGDVVSDEHGELEVI